MAMSSEKFSNRSKQKKAHSAENEIPLDRPFDKELYESARQQATRYRVILEQENHAYIGRVAEFPRVFVSAESAEECVNKLRAALTSVIATMLERNMRPPLPISERREQVNTRLSPEEKETVEAAYREAGFNSLSDFARYAMLTLAKQTLERVPFDKISPAH